MRHAIIAVLLLAALAGTAVAGPIEDAVAALARGDYATALREFRVLAEQGLADAQYNLGVMYAKGEGVPQDYAEAVKWFRLAADQAHDLALFNLGRMYGLGRGVPQDDVAAHMWFNLAASRLPPGEARNDAIQNRDIAEQRMTPAQVAAAQRLARNWLPQPETLTVEQRQARVARVQRGLSAQGYAPGPADGIVGRKTRAAIRAFQADYGFSVTGEVSYELELALLKARAARAMGNLVEPERASIEKHSTGSGFAVSGEGHVLTNNHVVAGCSEIRLPSFTVGRLLAKDTQADLALLKVMKDPKLLAEAKRRGLIPADQGLLPVVFQKPATFVRPGHGVRPGDAIVVVGFPLHGLLTSDPSVTTGNVSALAGPGDDRRFLQITAPVQQGNSGGPLLDLAGNVAGVVVAKLDAIKVANLTGDIPQNVNFAVSAWSARAFLDAYNVPYETAPSEPKLAARDVAAQAREFTVLVECWK